MGLSKTWVAHQQNGFPACEIFASGQIQHTGFVQARDGGEIKVGQLLLGPENEPP
jgi:hypothetical protein